LPLEGLPNYLVDRVLHRSPDDDVAILAATVRAGDSADELTIPITSAEASLTRTRQQITSALAHWNVAQEVAADTLLIMNELKPMAFSTANHRSKPE
jgi:hypothetical protein